jgi:hypothetical protein
MPPGTGPIAWHAITFVSHIRAFCPLFHGFGAIAQYAMATAETEHEHVIFQFEGSYRVWCPRAGQMLRFIKCPNECRCGRLLLGRTKIVTTEDL